MAVRTLVLLCATVVGSAEAYTATPIEKVVGLLTKLSAQIAAEGAQEAAEYDKFSCFCKEQADEKLYAIETSTEKINGLDASIKAKTAEMNTLATDITELTKKVSGLEGKIKTATDKRKADKATYDTQAQDMVDAIDACVRAVEALKESKGDIAGNDGKVDLAQLVASSPLVAAALAQQSPASFQYSSNDILATLEGLTATFKKNKAELDKTEFEANSAFEMSTQAMSTQVTFAEKEKAEKQEQSAALDEEKSEATEDKDEETKMKNADDEFMKVLTGECEGKAADWDQRSTMRSQEITAITSALDRLKKDSVGSYAVNKNLNDLQTKKVTSFLQIHGTSSRIEATQQVLALLMKRSESTNSPVLASLSMKVMVMQQSGIDHFVKVRALIKDLVTKLTADAKAEATAKAYCDTNLKKETTARDAALNTIEDKSSKLTVAKAQMAEKVSEIATLTAGIAQAKKDILEAQELRAEQKATNEASLSVSAEGKAGVEFALTVLQKFYGDAAKAALLQADYTPPKAGRDGKTVGDMAPKGFSGKYHGNQDSSTGIIGILQVISSDFQRTTDQVTKDEKESADAATEAIADYNKDITAKEGEIKTKEQKVADLKSSITTYTDDKIDAQKALKNALATLEDLKKMCIDGEETYTERKEKREEEISALKDALEILENWKN